jgi:hypothetical protein
MRSPARKHRELGAVTNITGIYGYTHVSPSHFVHPGEGDETQLLSSLSLTQRYNTTAQREDPSSSCASLGTTPLRRMAKWRCGSTYSNLGNLVVSFQLCAPTALNLRKEALPQTNEKVTVCVCHTVGAWIGAEQKHFLPLGIEIGALFMQVAA